MTKNLIISYLNGCNDEQLFALSSAVRRDNVGDKLFLRGLIELSNFCACDCLYCGIRRSNLDVTRYELSVNEVETAVRYAIDNRFGSVVLQAGEVTSNRFVDKVEELVRLIVAVGGGELGITLSLGQHSAKAYSRWREAGATRYLLRIESSSREIFAKIHPEGYLIDRRIEALRTLQSLDYQVGSGVMIGLPHQSIESLADDLIFLSEMDIDMCGMGPYIEHEATPLGQLPARYTVQQRVELTLRMVALLRVMMPSINIASTTALSSLNPSARLRAIEVGANVVMPNITPRQYHAAYNLYDNKATDLELDLLNVDYGQKGDSLRYQSRSRSHTK